MLWARSMAAEVSPRTLTRGLATGASSWSRAAAAAKNGRGLDMGKFVERFKKVAAKQRGAVAINRRVEDVGGLDVKQLRQVSYELVVLGGE
jgi:hypothetical protein